MANLIAMIPIRDALGFRSFLPGDALPQDHPDAAAWVDSGAAVWRDDDYTPPNWVRAKRAAAEPGLPGISVGGEQTGDDLVGKVPITEQRRRGIWKR